MTIPYYDRNATACFDATIGLDLSIVYLEFLPYVPAPGHILDAGCGSGRDARAFIERGYRVTAFDASKQMAELASRFLGRPVLSLRFDEMAWIEAFDGIWASASLLQVPQREMREVFHRFVRALKPEGVWYLSFRSGDGESRDELGRDFTNYTANALAALIGEFACLAIVKLWQFADVRKDREGKRGRMPSFGRKLTCNRMRPVYRHIWH